jgi:hypothetical protein
MSAQQGFERAYKNILQSRTRRSEKIKYQENEKNKKVHIKRDLEF